MSKYNLSDILNVCVTRKDKKKPHSLSNVLMLGFPDHSVAKFKKLTNCIEENTTNTTIEDNIIELNTGASANTNSA